MTRRSGVLGGLDDIGLSDHAAWSYTSDRGRARVAASWLQHGLETGQRAFYVADAAVPELVRELEEWLDAATALSTGALVLASSTEVYDLSTPIDPAAQLAGYDQAVRQALDDGYRGLRVAADITPLVADRSRRAAHLRWEQFADRYMTEHPLSPLCLYDARRITGLDAIVSAHPLQGPDPPVFAFCAKAPTRAAVRGEIDGCSAGVFADVLRALPDTDDALDLTGVTFLDGRGAWTLHDELRRRRLAGRPIAVIGVSPLIRRLWDLCRFDPALLGIA